MLTQFFCTSSYLQLDHYCLNLFMLTVNPQYITDDAGKKLSVMLSISEFNSLMEELDELEDIRLYDEAKKRNTTSIPIEEAFQMIEEQRRNK